MGKLHMFSFVSLLDCHQYQNYHTGLTRSGNETSKIHIATTVYDLSYVSVNG